MREFTFDVEYDTESDPVMDVFIETPELAARSLDGCTGAGFWRVERVTGPPAALHRLTERYLDASFAATDAVDGGLAETHEVDMLSRARRERVFYTYVGGIHRGDSVHTLASRYLPPGLLFETHRRDDCRQWRIVMRDDGKVGLLYDALGAAFRGDRRFKMGHLRDAEGWRQDALTAVSLTAVQEAALEAALEHGYYETPREISLDNLADELDVPRSTLSYRLRRAEAALAAAYVDR